MAGKPSPGQSEAPQPQPLKKSLLREYAEALAIAVVLALIIRALVIQAFSIPSGSMLPTLLIGDYLLVNKFIYGIRNPFNNKVLIPITRPQRGDVVVFIFPQDPSKDYIKRVMGLPGERVQIINKKLYINGQLVETPQAITSDPEILPPPSRLTDSARDHFGPVVVPQDAYFVLGDNRDHSYDSRFWGFVHLDAIRGKAFIIYFSWTGDQSLPVYFAFLKGLTGLAANLSWNSEAFAVRWDRIGKLIR